MNGTELREALKAKGITNGRRLSEYLDCPVIFFVVSSRNNYLRAELHYKQYGESKSLVRMPDPGLEGLSQKRLNAVNKARTAAEGLCALQPDEWSRSPFSNCWMPTEKLSQLHEEFENKGA